MFFLTLLLLSFTSHAQSKPPLAIEDPQMGAYLQNRQSPTLEIQIINAPDSAKKIDVKCTFVTFGSNFQFTKYYTTSANGFLKINLDQNLPCQQIWLTAGHYLYAGIYVNTSLVVTIDASQIKNKDGVYLMGNGVTYSGADGELNRVMSSHILYRKNEQDDLSGRMWELCQARKNYSADAFTAKTDSVWTALKRIDSEFLQQYPDYQWAISNETASFFYGMLTVAYWSDTMPQGLFAEINEHKPYFTSNNGATFYSYLKTYLGFKTGNMLHKIKKIDSLYTPTKADILKTFLLDDGKNTFATAYPEIINSMKTRWCKQLADHEFNQMTIKQREIDSILASAKKLSSADHFIGVPIVHLPFNANLYELDSIKSVDSLIVNLKSKFKHKALIIDFWATWCSPCLHEMPYSKKLHDNNKDLPIAFIYICTNSSSNTTIWKNKITELQLSGTHIFMDEKIVEALKSSFNNGGAGFPTYVVIDINGKLRPKTIQWMQSMKRDDLKNAVGVK